MGFRGLQFHTNLVGNLRLKKSLRSPRLQQPPHLEEIPTIHPLEHTLAIAPAQTRIPAKGVALITHGAGHRWGPFLPRAGRGRVRK